MAEQGIPLIGPIMNKLIGSRNDRFVKKYTQRVEAIGALEPKIRQMSDEQLRAMLDEFRAQYDGGTSTEDLMIEAFAVAREAMDRAVGIRNIFNPEHAEKFEKDRLSAAHLDLYEKTKSKLDAMEPREPVDDLLGNPDPVPPHVWAEFPHELYDAVRELYPESRPPFRARPFDVQLIGAMVLAGGKIAEMRTGEGKTIVAPLACYLAAIGRQQVHVVTVNDYLVQRDRDWTFPFFRALGLTVGAIHPQHTQPEDVKRQMYRCDAVYGTTAEFGFDYLRDNMKRSVEQQVQKQRQFAIVDEVDSTLIDEARTPLIISGPAHDDKPRYDLADKLARHLVEKHKPWEQAEKKVQSCIEQIKGLEGDIRQVADKGKIPELNRQLAEQKKLLPDLERERDQHQQYYEAKPERKSAHLTHDGIAEAQRVAGIGSFYVDQNMDVPHLLEQAVRAHAIYQRDRDYVIMNLPDPRTGQPSPSVVIVDTNTGRPMVGRQWSDGLHQAVESKEAVPIKDETQTVASITIQNFFKMYKRLAGMTGTADTEAQEFHDIYQLDVVSIPTNKPVVRDDSPDMVYLRQRDKWESIVDEIKAFHDAGRPILVGTTSVEKSEMISAMLKKKHGIQHEVLNAKQHEREGNIVEDAGQLGAVMIATNMAGRGTDIKLGSFTREQLLEHWLKRGVVSRKITVDSTVEQLREDAYRKLAPSYLPDVRKREAEQMPFEELELQLLRHWVTQTTMLSSKGIANMSADALREVLDESGRMILHNIRWFENIEQLGGLHVIGTERHEARRIDNQLRGRSGRQGDRGSSRFYVSLEDELMQMFGGNAMMKLLPKLGLKEGDAIESGMLSNQIAKAQKKVEERNFQIRKNILEYDEVMEHQRQTFYGIRQRVLEGRDVRGLIFEFLSDTIELKAEEFLDPMYPFECVAEYAKEQLDCSVLADRLKGRDADELETIIRREAKADARQSIDLTLGEYIPIEGSEIAVDFDSAGLVSWAKSRFDVEIDAAELREGGAAERRQVFDLLVNAAEERIERADLSGVTKYLVANYGAKELCEWAKTKFGFELSVDEIVNAQQDDELEPLDIVIGKARELYTKREVEYGVDYALELTMVMMRQDPKAAAEQLATWAKRRYGLELSGDELMKLGPQKIRERLLEASREFVESDRMTGAIEKAVAIGDDDTLDTYLQDTYGVGLPPRMRFLRGEEREEAVRSRVESILRAELLELERTVIIDTMDQAWKDHLYQMDQLRDTISFRSFSQQDPRIAFKKEGSQLFSDFLGSIEDRVCEYVFKGRISPAAMLQQQIAQQRAQLQAQQAQQQRAAGPAPAGAGLPTGSAPASGAAAARPGSTGLASQAFSGPGFDPFAPIQKPGPSQISPTQASPGQPSPADEPAANGTSDATEQDDSAGDDEAPTPAEQMERAKAARAADRGKKGRTR